MVGNEEFFKKFRALIILFLISTPRRKKSFSPMLCHGLLKLKGHCKYLQWNLGQRKNCTLNKYLLYVIQLKIVDNAVNHCILV